MMQETANAIQGLAKFFVGYWYFSFVYIWWVATTILSFKEKKLESWKQKEVPFNWVVYLIILGVLLALFYGNRAAFNALFEGGLKILIVIAIFLKDLIVCVGQLLSLINFEKMPVIIPVILFLIVVVKWGRSIGNLLAEVVGMVLGGGIALIIMLALLSIPIAILVLLLEDLRKKWFSWYEFKYQHALIPLIALFFYPATNFTLNFLVESLTRHPLEGALTVKTSRKTWFFIIGLLILLTGIIGKILGKVK